MKRKARVFSDTLKKFVLPFAVLIICFASSGAVFYLYGLLIEPFFYAAAIVVFIMIVFFFIFFEKELKKAKKREQMISEALMPAPLPISDTLSEEDYQTAIIKLRNEITKLRNEFTESRQDDVDYYTTWVHQIKTPIAAMRMELGESEYESSVSLEAELFRIEQYVDMVLTYIRLGGDCNDLVIKEYALDELIRETIRKFAPQFVAKKLSLSYDGCDHTVVTDKKWFICILEQIISNAVKYTQTGGITIKAENNVLSVSDTGIGISPEDIARIFEKGYTGENGRYEKRSSGLGLYLCKKSADLLNIPVSVESTVGKGSTFSLDLKNKIL